MNFAKKFVIISVIQVNLVIFFPAKFCQALPKLQRRRRPALEQGKFLSGVKTVQILQFARHLKEKVFKCAHDYQIENLAETNFVEIFGRAKQILSVPWVRAQICHGKPPYWMKRRLLTEINYIVP